VADRRLHPALRRRGRGIAAFTAALLVAWLATLLLAPSDSQLLPVADVDAREEFTQAQIDRGADYRRPQTIIGLLALAAEIALLAYLARANAFQVRHSRTFRAFGAGALLSAAIALVTLPFGIVARTRAIDAGLSTDSWLEWARDRALGALIAAVLAGALAAIALALIRRFKHWWIPGSGLVVIAAAVLTFATPVVLDPLFNDFRRLEDGPLRDDVVRLGEEAGVRVTDVEVVDASRRTSAANAYVTGLGASKKVVLYDNVLEDFPRAEARSILAHELGHERYDDVPRGLLFVAIVAPLGVLAIALLAGSAPTLPALALALVLVSTSITWISNGLSRQVEARADAFALRVTDDPDAFAGLQRRLALRNRSDVDPPDWVRTVLSTHPSTVERLGMARAYQRAEPGGR
jgi:STE24 endopeptidase